MRPLASLLASYRALAEGLVANQHRRTRAPRDALRVAHWFRDHEDIILRFITSLADFTPALQEILAGKQTVQAGLSSVASQYDSQTGS